jgi:uncharacterized protein with PIN domain
MQLICDRMLGRLARYLRMLGYAAPLVQEPPLRLAGEHFFLTRRRKLMGKPSVLFIEHDLIQDQLSQVLADLELSPDPALWLSRCLECNEEVEHIPREKAWGLVPDFTYHNAPGFTRCPNCQKIFWPGSHAKRAMARLEALLQY